MVGMHAHQIKSSSAVFLRLPLVWYSVTRVSKKFFSLESMQRKKVGVQGLRYSWVFWKLLVVRVANHAQFFRGVRKQKASGCPPLTMRTTGRSPTTLLWKET